MAAITVPIISEFVSKGLEKANEEFDKFGKKGKSGIDKVKAAALPAAAALTALTAGATKLVGAGEAAATSNARIEQIASSMGLFGEETEMVTDRLIALSEETARMTGVDQNAIKATQAKLLTFGELAESADEVGGQFDRATQAAIDLAAAGFGSAESNAVQLGKALNDPIKGITALAKSGVTFTEQEKEKIETLVESGQMLEAQNLILQALETQVGGTALATANDTDKMKVGFSQVSEQLGLVLLPILNDILPVVLRLTKFVGDNADAFLIVGGIIGGVAAAILAVNAAVTAYQAITKAVTIVQGVFNAVMAANPIFLIGVAIAAVIAAFVLLEKRFKVITKAVEAAKIVFEAIGTALMDAFKAAFNFIARIWNDTVGQLQFDIPSWVPIIGGNTFGVPKIPMLAEGGLVTGPQLAMIGEAGPELVVPLDRVSEMGGGGTYNITINMPAGANGDAVVRAIQQHARRTGRTPIATTNTVRR